MCKLKLSLLSLLLWLSFNNVKGQLFSDFKSYSLSVGYGVGKIQYYANNHPVITIGSNNEKLKYSPSLYLAIKGRWNLFNKVDFTLAIEHTTVTENNSTSQVPTWAGFGEKKLIQGFQHITPSISLTFRKDLFSISSGFRMGTASFIGNTNARETSNSVGGLDFGYITGCSIRIFNNTFVEINWIQALTKYGIIQNDLASFYKYHLFSFGLSYIFHETI